ncbi:unnamed protein product [Symbiodinium sp. CCMP2456]|nr:unnamed protein product [Symbiodinium sp. CCMP2456]
MPAASLFPVSRIPIHKFKQRNSASQHRTAPNGTAKARVEATVGCRTQARSYCKSPGSYSTCSILQYKKPWSSKQPRRPRSSSPPWSRSSESLVHPRRLTDHGGCFGGCRTLAARCCARKARDVDCAKGLFEIARRNVPTRLEKQLSKVLSVLCWAMVLRTLCWLSLAAVLNGETTTTATTTTTSIPATATMTTAWTATTTESTTSTTIVSSTIPLATTSSTSSTLTTTSRTYTSQTTTTRSSTSSTTTTTRPETCDVKLLSVLQSLGVAPDEAFKLACDTCRQSAVKCDSEGRVVALNLRRKGLKGHLPADLSDFGQLRQLRLGFNRLTGPIPKELGLCSNLELLQLTGNQLSGPLPRELGKLRKLKQFLATGNNLSGHLPETLGDLSALERLHLSDNRLSGPLPAELGKLLELQDLRLAFNQLEGILPGSLGMLKSLRALLLQSNKLTGQLPVEIGSLVKLRRLELFDNQLVKPLPPELGQLRSLQILRLSRNHFEGALPKELGHLLDLRQLDLSENSFTGNIPEIGRLQNLEQLNLRNNLLEGTLMPLDFQALAKLDLSRNRFTGSLKLSPGLPKIRRLSLRGNRLSGPIPVLAPLLRRLDLGENRFSGEFPEVAGLTQLVELKVDGNQISGELSEDICRPSSLRQFSCGRNLLQGRLPDCLWKMPRLQQLSLHSNGFVGVLPQIILARSLVVLTLHNNAISGPLPKRFFSELPNLAILTLHGNSLTGSIADGISLKEPCLDNPHFELRGMDCRDWGDESVAGCKALASSGSSESSGLAREELRELITSCPRSCQECENPSFQLQNPMLTLHRNALSCGLPEKVTNAAASVFALVVMGNMVGDGHDLPSWVHIEERQEFLYFSDRAHRSDLFIGFGMAFVLLGLVFARGRIWKALFQAAHYAHESSQVSAVSESCFGVLRFTTLSAILCFAMFPLYVWGATYYSCGQPLSRTTAAYLKGPWETLLVCIFWSLLTLFFAAAVAALPSKRAAGLKPLESGPRGCKLIMFWMLWLVVVIGLSVPSILFAVSQALPAGNSSGLSHQTLQIVHRAAPALIVAVDMLLASALSRCFSALTGIRTDRLLMILRLCSAWLLSLLTTLILHENCLAGWKFFWSVCDARSPRHELFTLRIWDEEMMNTDADMCQLEPSWWKNGRCSRAMIEGLAPLLMKKLLLRTCLQPVLLLIAWQLSKLDSGERSDGSRQLRLFKVGPTTSGCLSPVQQHALLTTYMETTIFWGPLNPLVSFCVATAAAVNALLFNKAVTDFGVRMPTDHASSVSTVSRDYLVCSIIGAAVFQMWHAFGTGMKGQVLLVLATVAVLVFTLVPFGPVHCGAFIRCVRWIIWRPGNTNEEAIELTCPDSPSDGELPKFELTASARCYRCGRRAVPAQVCEVSRGHGDMPGSCNQTCPALCLRCGVSGSARASECQLPESQRRACDGSPCLVESGTRSLEISVSCNSCMHLEQQATKKSE